MIFHFIRKDITKAQLLIKVLTQIEVRTFIAFILILIPCICHIRLQECLMLSLLQ